MIWFIIGFILGGGAHALFLLATWDISPKDGHYPWKGPDQ